MTDKLYTIGATETDTDITVLTKNVFTIYNYLKQKNRQLLKGLDLYHSYILDTSYEEHKLNQMMIDEFNKKLDKIGWDIKL